MSSLRRLWPALVLVSLGLALAVGVPRASATDPFPDLGIATLSSQNFTVSYSRNNLGYQNPCPNPLDWYISQEKAGDVLGMAERAYALYLSWGYAPAPSTPIQISVDDFADSPGAVPCGVSYANGHTYPDPAAVIDGSIPGPFNRWNALINPAATGNEIHLDASTGLSYHIIAHEVFHLFQLAMVPSAMNVGAGTNTLQWLSEGTAEWAAFRAESFLTPTKSDLGQNPDRTSDCVGSECGDTELDRNGYPGWLLFEYLSERFGTGAVKSVWDQAVANLGASAATDLSNVLVADGTTLSSFFNDYATARLTGKFSLAAIQGLLPTTQASIAVGDVTGDLSTTNVAVNHLAVRYVALHHGGVSDVRAPCYAATLTINVGIPANVTSTPYYYANTTGSTAQALTVSGSNASITVPWNTCAGSPDAYLSLPNDSWNPGYDGTEFVITGTVNVNLSAPASPSDPQPGTSYLGPVVVAPTSDPAPRLTVHAPELLRVNARDRVLRFIVYSSGSGNLRATLGSVQLGSVGLRAGNNDVRWTLPASLVTALRRTSAASLLSLTSLSPSGTAGATVTRHVVIVTTKKRRHR